MRSWRFGLVSGAVVGVILAFATSYVPTADASRNSSGTYSLPAGQPVVAGTTISASTHNTLAADIATELTSSLDRSGRGAMLAPLKLANGTAAAPALSFDTDTDDGLYRAASDTPAMSVDSTQRQSWTTTGSTITGTFSVSGISSYSQALRATDGAGSAPAYSFTNDDDSGLYRAGAGDIRISVDNGDRITCTAAMTTVANGLTVTENTANGSGVTATGNGTATGMAGFGGTTSGTGTSGTGGAPNGIGVVGVGTGSGAGASFTGGGSGGNGITVVGGATNGVGINVTAGSGSQHAIVSTGTGTGTGGSFANGTAATSGTPQNAVVLTNGYLGFSGVTSPSSTTGITNALAPTSLVKAWGIISCNTASAPTVAAGFNVASVAMNGGTDILVTIANDMASAVYAVIAMSSTSNRYIYAADSKGAGAFILNAHSTSAGTQVDHDAFTAADCVQFMVLGAQ